MGEANEPAWDYFVSAAQPEHGAEIEAVRRVAYARSKEFEWHDCATLAWSPTDEEGTVMAVWDRSGRICSTARVVVRGSRADAESLMEYSLDGVPLPLPCAVSGRSATLPEQGGRGRLALIRYALMRAIVRTPLAAVVTQLYEGPGIASMPRNGYLMYPTTASWDSEAKALTPTLIGLLRREQFEQAMVHAHSDFGPGVQSPRFDIDAIACDLMRQCQRL